LTNVQRAVPVAWAGIAKAWGEISVSNAIETSLELKNSEAVTGGLAARQTSNVTVEPRGTSAGPSREIVTGSGMSVGVSAGVLVMVEDGVLVDVELEVDVDVAVSVGTVSWGVAVGRAKTIGVDW
jgi:hypothetical protein